MVLFRRPGSRQQTADPQRGRLGLYVKPTHRLPHCEPDRSEMYGPRDHGAVPHEDDISAFAADSVVQRTLHCGCHGGAGAIDDLRAHFV